MLIVWLFSVFVVLGIIAMTLDSYDEEGEKDGI